jgi:hypothetical protein
VEVQSVGFQDVRARSEFLMKLVMDRLALLLDKKPKFRVFLSFPLSASW